jgi:transposase InsO family protein
LNALAERFVRSIKEERLNRMIFFGQASLRRAIAQYMTHYHCERNHQELGNRLLQPISAKWNFSSTWLNIRSSFAQFVGLAARAVTNPST